MPNHRLLALLILCILIAVSIISVYLFRPPSALPANAPALEFSAGRAMQHVQVIARQPHSIGTMAHQQVRSYLITELKKLSIQTQVQATVVSSQALRRTGMAYVQNVIGVLKGTNNEKAVLLMAHYDSQPNTPGAGDNGAGVAALLETARALRADPPLKNDVIFLMTDGEEFGLFGARAFLQHPLAAKVGIVLNLEGRGNSGPSLTFEISPENGWVVEQFEKVAPYPIANSLMYEVYRLLPNDTDFSIFRQAGYKGFNSAFIDGYVHYHKLTDQPKDLNPNSIQHHGSNTLALSQHFGNISLARTAAPDKIFFNPIGKWFVQYPASYNKWWILITGVLVVVFFITGIIKKAFTFWQMVKGFFFFPLVIVLVAGLLMVVNQAVIQLLPFHRFINGVYQADLFFVAYVLLTFGFFLLLSRLALQFISLWGFAAGILILFFTLVVLIYLFVQAAVFILLFPLMFFSLGAIGAMFFKEHQRSNLLASLILLVGYLPAVFMLVPLASIIWVAFALQLPLAMVLVLLLFWGLGFPLWLHLERNFTWRFIPVFSFIVLVTGLLLTASAIYREKPSPSQPLHSDVSYYLDTNLNQAFWASGYTKTDEWNQQFFPEPTIGLLSEIFPAAANTVLKSKAKPILIVGPNAKVLSDTIFHGKRHLKLHLQSPRKAGQIQIDIINKTEDALLAATINRVAIPNPKKVVTTGVLLSTLLLGLPAQGVELALVMEQTEGVQLLLYDRSVGLPEALIKVKRPTHVVPEQGINSNITVVKKSYLF